MAKGGKRAGAGRPKGSPNKFTKALKDMILEAADRAGGEGGTVAYLERQAVGNPGPFMALLGKVLPTQLTGDPENPIEHKVQSDAAFGKLADALAGAAKAKSGSTGG